MMGAQLVVKIHHIDAPFPAWTVDGNFFYHLPDNAVLTSNTPITVPTTADAIMIKEDGGGDDEMTHIGLAFDHCFMIRNEIPFSQMAPEEAVSKKSKEW
jgi:hypothetical protein